MVFYRKYRPQKIDDLDNEHLREILFSVLSKDPPHAFLFTGPKGLGKTSTARIIAKVVNCTERAINQEPKTKNKEQEGKVLSSKSMIQSGEAIEPCNECEQCTSITNGTNMDVLEIDAASNRGIDEIRDLKEKIRLAPLSAKKKVYIIDEVHMLTTEAFNALLKTLEEPPAHAMFILCTTEPHKVPATILSRSFHISFKPATEEELIRSFRRVVNGEKIDITDEVLRDIARLSDRGFRDGAKILEEVTLLAQGKSITKQLIEETYKTASVGMYVFSFFNALEEKESPKEALKVIQTLIDEGIDIKYFISYVIDMLHKYLLKEFGISNTEQLTNRSFTIKEIKQMIFLFTRAYGDTKYAVLPQLPLELAIIEYCAENMLAEEISNSPAQEDSGGKAIKVQEVEEEVSISSLRKQVGVINKKKMLYGSAEQNTASSNKKKTIQSDVNLLQTSPHGDVTKEWQDVLWRNIIEEMKKHNHTIAGILRGCHIKSYDRKVLIIETGYKFHKERLDDMRTRTVLIQTCKLLTGKEIEVEVELRK